MMLNAKLTLGSGKHKDGVSKNSHIQTSPSTFGSARRRARVIDNLHINVFHFGVGRSLAIATLYKVMVPG
jgi:hypothetical protein